MHRIFLEYFVTQGIVDEFAEHRSPQADAQRRHGFTSFHDLVLNIDMHRFLRELAIAKAEAHAKAAGVAMPESGEWWWYQETAVAYGLTAESAAEWTPKL